ncbi:hypothetical protein [Nocardioides xinjiangensis]|uniref:hypothetical protein n=1 Tax=Nocardioides xinjiangensis TaxID=2817376 RepID=UPI001B311328|nr:hypothetical protein [Nocardioides sp. SYSU D00778]
MTTRGHGRTGRFARTTTIAAVVALTAGGLATTPAHAEPTAADPSLTETSVRGLTAGDPVTISSGTVPITDHAGMLRTPDRVLHVSYTRATSPGYVQAAHAAISPTGRVLRRTDITGPWLSQTASTIVPAPGGRMRVVLNGHDEGAYHQSGAYSATGDGSGAWTLPTERLNKFWGGTDAVSLVDGTPLTAVLHWSGLFTHTGSFTTDNTHAPAHQQAGASGAYNPNLERLGDEVYVAWNVLAGSGPGTFVQRVHPALGPVVPAPGSSGSADAVGSSNPSPLAASTTGQLYSAYCTGTGEFECRHISLWNITTGHVQKVPGSAGARAITLSPAPEGRMWITWRSDSSELTGVRTNRSGTAVSDPSVRPMGDEFSFPHSAAESSLGFADVLLMARGGHVLTRLLPTLRLDASTRRLRAGQAKRITFRVTDAGDAVAGARVRGAGATCRTGSSGRCTLRLDAGRPRRIQAKVMARGHADGATVLRVRR